MPVPTPENDNGTVPQPPKMAYTAASFNKTKINEQERTGDDLELLCKEYELRFVVTKHP